MGFKYDKKVEELVGIYSHVEMLLNQSLSGEAMGQREREYILSRIGKLENLSHVVISDKFKSNIKELVNELKSVV